MFGLIIFIVALILIGVGIAMGLVALALAAALVGLGIVSSSVLAGLLAGRPQTGIRVFLLQCGALAGIPAGAISAWLLQNISAHLDESWLIPLYGGIGGALAGILIALLIDFILRRLHSWATQQLDKDRSTRLSSDKPISL